MTKSQAKGKRKNLSITVEQKTKEKVKLSEESRKLLDELCRKPKRLCALCGDPLTLKKAREKYEDGAVLVVSLKFNHPLFKSKSFNTCGPCGRRI